MMADSSAQSGGNSRPIRFQQRLDEDGTTVELILTPSEGEAASNPSSNGVQLAPFADDVDEENRVFGVILSNFTGRLSVRRIQRMTRNETLEHPESVQHANTTPTSSQQPSSESGANPPPQDSISSHHSAGLMESFMKPLYESDEEETEDSQSMQFLLPSLPALPTKQPLERNITDLSMSSADVNSAIEQTNHRLSGPMEPLGEEASQSLMGGGSNHSVKSRGNCPPRATRFTAAAARRTSNASTRSGALMTRRRQNRTSMFDVMRRQSARNVLANNTASRNLEPNNHNSEANRKKSISEFMSQGAKDRRGQTDLHWLVSSTELTLSRLEDLLDQNPDAVKTADANGRLPLHLLGSNSDLVNYPEGQALAKQCAILLIEMYPFGIIQTDNEGRMPFTYLIGKWVEWTHEQDAQSYRSLNSSMHDSRHGMGGFFRKVLGTNQHPCRLDISTVTDNSPSTRSLSDSSNRFPPVMIFEEVEWCFEMLSLAMDHLGGRPFEQNQNARPQLTYKKQRADRLALASNVASIPQLLKTTLLLDSNETRNKILDSAVMHRVLLCPASVGPWLTSMLRYKKGTSSEMAINFLVRLSLLTVEDYVGSYRKALPLDEDLFKDDKLRVYEAVENLKDIVPSLLILPNDLLDRAIATPVIWFIMNRHVTTPFTVGLSSTDFQLQITTIIAVRQAAFGLVPDDGFSEVFPFLDIIAVVLFGCFFQLLRVICEAFALNRISSKVALRYISGPWRILDFVGVCLAMWATIQYAVRIENGYYIENADDVPAMVYALIVGLLWFRILGFLKAVNESLATFVIALVRIIFDLRFFCIVMLVFILLFGDMFHVLYLNDPTLQQECSSGDPSEPATDFCNPDRVIFSYLRVYAIMIEDFALSDYLATPALTLLWMFITFLGFVVLMATLIAVINRSYEQSQNSSIILFRRARCEFVASNQAIEGFLRPEFFNPQSGIRCNAGGIILVLSRWFLLFTFFITVGLSSLYLLQRLVESFEDSNILQFVAVLFLCLSMVFNLWSTFVFLVATFYRIFCGGRSDPLKRFIFAVNQFWVDKMAGQIFGIDVNETDGGELIPIDDEGPGREEELLSRMDRLEKTLERALAQNATLEGDHMTLDHVSIVKDL